MEKRRPSLPIIYSKPVYQNPATTNSAKQRLAALDINIKIRTELVVGLYYDPVIARDEAAARNSSLPPRG